MTLRRFPAVVFAALALVTLASFVAAGAEVKAELKDVMNAVNNGDGSVAGQLKAQFNQGSLDDEGWAIAKGRAAMLVEAANMIAGMKPPRGADDDAGLAGWKKHVAAYKACAEAAHDAAVKKDVAAGKAAVQSLHKRCSECHKDHQPE